MESAIAFPWWRNGYSIYPVDRRQSVRRSIISPMARDKIPAWCGAALIVIGVLAAYLPAVNAGYVWDDDFYLTRNPLITAPDGLRRIWFSLDSPSQYFPLVYTMFRIENSFWGFDPRGYHLVNIILHAACALLLWLVLHRLSVRGAWLAAALFALHPVNVESVAWITERKNVLSLFFSLLTVLAWLAFIRGEGWRRRVWYTAALVLYALALFAKTTAATLPAALLLVLWLGRERVGRERVLRLVPFAVMGVAMGLVTVWWERHHQGTQGPEFAFTVAQRLIISGRALWFYLGKLAWPSKLSFSYPRWEIDAGDARQYLWLLAALAAGAAIWFRRRVLARGVTAAAAFYVVTILPTLGFISLYTFRYSFVADHYQYVAGIGPLALLAAGLARRRISPAADLAARLVLPGMLLLALGVMTWRQCGIYRDEETIWRDTLAKNPRSWIGRNKLGLVLTARREFEAAEREYREAIRLRPDCAETYNNLGTVLFYEGRLQDAETVYREALRQRPDDPDMLVNLANTLDALGRQEEAVEGYRNALRLDPRNAPAHANLAVVLEARGRADEAELRYREAVRLKPEYAWAHNGLGALLMKQGRTREAADRFREALRIDPAYADAHRNLGLALRSLGDAARAASHFEAASRLQAGARGPARDLSDDTITRR